MSTVWRFYEQSVVEAFPDAPLVSYIELLRALRLDNNSKPTLTRAQLDASKPVFEQSQNCRYGAICN